MSTHRAVIHQSQTEYCHCCRYEWALIAQSFGVSHQREARKHWNAEEVEWQVVSGWSRWQWKGAHSLLYLYLFLLYLGFMKLCWNTIWTNLTVIFQDYVVSEIDANKWSFDCTLCTAQNVVTLSELPAVCLVVEQVFYVAWVSVCFLSWCFFPGRLCDMLDQLQTP